MAKKSADNPERDNSVSAAEIAFSQEIPLQYAQQILQRLRKGKLIDSLRGPGGGYYLAKNPNLISLKDILSVAEGETFEVICEVNAIYDDCGAEHSHCALRPVWYELRNAINHVLENKSLTSLVEESNKHSGCTNGCSVDKHKQVSNTGLVNIPSSTRE